MLGSGDGFVVLRIVALEAADKSRAQPAGEEGVLAISLMPSAPTGIAEDVDVGRPVVQACGAGSYAHAAAGQVGTRLRGHLPAFVVVELGTRFGADDGRHAEDQRLVEGRAQTDGL